MNVLFSYIENPEKTVLKLNDSTFFVLMAVLHLFTEGMNLLYFQKSMLGLLCGEGSIVKIFSPPALIHALFSCCLHKKFKYSLQENCLGWIMFNFCWFKRYIFWYYVAYVCIVYIDGFKVHYKVIYYEKFTVEETRHFSWPCLEKMKPR